MMMAMSSPSATKDSSSPSADDDSDDNNVVVRVVDRMPEPIVSSTSSSSSTTGTSSSSSGRSSSSSSPSTTTTRTSIKNEYYLLRHGQSTANVNNIISSSPNRLANTTVHGLTDLGIQQARTLAAQQLVELLEQQQKQEKEGEQERGDDDDDDNDDNDSSDMMLTPRPRDRLLFVSSPFARAKQTAEQCLDAILTSDDLRTRIVDGLGMDIMNKKNDEEEIWIHDNIMERYFGKLDDKHIDSYAYVWPLDRFNVTHTTFDVESVAAVATRIRDFIFDMEHRLASSSSTTTTRPSTNTKKQQPIKYHIVCVSHADVLQIAQLYIANVTNVGTFSSYRFANGEVRKLVFGGGEQTLPEPNPLLPPKRSTKTTTTTNQQ